MRKLLYGLGMAVVLGLGVLCLRVQAAEDDVVKDVGKTADGITAKTWEAAVKDAAPVAKKYEQDELMHLLSPRKETGKGGVGIGPKPGVHEHDGIEKKIQNMTKQGLKPEEIANYGKEFKRMAEITAAIAAATMHQVPVKTKMGDKDPELWKRTSKEMYEGAQDLVKAIDAKDNAKIKAAAKKMNTSCVDCHGPFRE